MRKILLVGPPESGKVSMAFRMARELGLLTEFERGELSAIHMVGGYELGLADRPFRAPHHTVSSLALAGGRAMEQLRLSEVSLAHNGTLLLDGLTDFRRGALEALANVMAKGVVQVGPRSRIPSRPKLLVATACTTADQCAVEECAKILGIEEVVHCQPVTVMEMIGGKTGT